MITPGAGTEVLSSEFRRHLPAQGNDAPHRSSNRGRGTKGHGDTLRETRKHQVSVSRILFFDGIDHFGGVEGIVRNGEFPILAGHPTRHDIVAAAAIETMKSLDGKNGPAARSFDRLKACEVCLCGFCISVKSREKRKSGLMRLDEI